MHALDWLVMLAYAGLVLWIGWRASDRTDSASAFMLGDRSIPPWAALCSLIATELSAATFLGVPHAAYTGDWTYLQFLIGSIVGRLLIATWLLGQYFKLELVTVYGLLGHRFGLRSQRAAAWLFLVGRVLASGVRLFIAALAFAQLTGFSIELSIVLAGGVAGIYTRAGGIRAVIWTDVLQGGVFLVAGLTVLAVIAGHLAPAGLSAVVAAAGDKLTVIRWPAPLLDALPDGTSSTLLWERLALGWRRFVDGTLGQAGVLPSALIGGLFLTLAAQGTDQDLVQRLLTTRDARGGARALVISGFVNVPLVALFLCIGTGLWALHEPTLGLAPAGAFPPPADPKQVLPSFALLYLPAGLRGLVFAGLFAAAMSSLDSAVNALATSWAVDIRGTAGVAPTPPALRRATTVFTALLVLAALLFVSYERLAASQDGLSLVELALAAMSVVYGGLLGSFLVALLTPNRGRDGSVTVGMLVGATTGAALFLQPVWLGRSVIAWPWWIALSALVAFSIGALPRRARDCSDA
ncbi:MAG: hypothetical protein H6713_03105 [Myxococcales bacterium]|nr:hypothetical protein [Myxococcales bacterium]